MGTFDDLNNILFEQLERLKGAKGDELKTEIERSRSMAGIAKNVIGNARLAYDIVNLQTSAGMSLEKVTANAPKLLGCERVVVNEVTVEKIVEKPVKEPVPWEVGDQWLMDNAEKHSVSFLADRLSRPADQVRERCEKLGVSPKVLSYKGHDWCRSTLNRGGDE